MDGNITIESNGSSTFGSYPPLVSAILYGTIVSLSLILNFFVFLLFVCRNHLLYNPHNRCILALAITDILLSIAVLTGPDFLFGETFYNTKGHNHVKREVYCRLIWSKYLPYAIAVTSLYTSVVLSFERWLAVKRGMFYKNQFTVYHMNLLMIASWIAGIITGIPSTVLVEGVYDRPSQTCQFVLAKSKLFNTLLPTGLFLLQVVVPLTLITFAYVEVFRGIKTSL